VEAGLLLWRRVVDGLRDTADPITPGVPFDVDPWVIEAQAGLRMRVEIVRKPAEQRGFAVHPKRWVVERSLAWLTAHRRLARDYERDPAVSEAFIRWAAINAMIRRLDRGRPATRQQRRIINAPD
jgi:hypothetical protein